MPYSYLDNEAGMNPYGAAATGTGSHPTIELQDYLKEEFRRFSIDYDKRARFWNTLHQQFRGVIEKGTSQVMKSRLFVNRTRVATRSGVSNVLDVIFPGQDFYDVVGRPSQNADSDFNRRAAELSKQVMDWDLLVSEYIPESVLYVLQAAIYGTTFGKIVLQEVTDTVIQKLPKMHPLLLEPVGYRTKEVKKTLRFAGLETVDIYSMRIDPTATTIYNASGLFHEMHRTLQYLRMMESRGVYSNIDEVEKMISKLRPNYLDKRRKNVGLLDQGIISREDVKLFEYWGKVPSEVAKNAGIDVDEGEYETEIIATMVGSGNPEILIRQERNTNPAQERMFISDVWEPSGDNSLYGIGIPEAARGSQLALNATINTRLDNKAWAIANPVVVDIGKIEVTTDLVARPNWIIRTKGRPDDVVKFGQIPDVTQTAYLEAAEFERYIDDESGMNKVVQASEGLGGAQGGGRTKGGIAIAYSAASRPIRFIARGFEQNLVAKGLKKIFMVFVTNMNEEIVIRITGDNNAIQYLQVDPFSLALDVDFIPSGSFALTQREQMLDSLTMWFDGVSKVLPSLNPMLDGRPNFMYLAEKFYQSLGLKDWQKAWFTPQQLQGNPAALAMTQGGQGGPAQKGGPGGAVQGGPAQGAAGMSPIMALFAQAAAQGGRR